LFQGEHARVTAANWPEGVLEAAAQFQQGDAVEVASLAFSYHAQYPVSAIAKQFANERNGLVGARVDVQFAMITTPTCDLAGPRGKKYPLLLVAPIYNIAGHTLPSQEPQIRNNDFGYLIPLTGERFVRDGDLWVADLRFEAAIEKGALVDHTPVAAFASDAEYLRARRKIGRAHFRPAISQNVEDAVLAPLRAKWGAAELDHAPIIELFVKATPKTVAADAVRLYFLVKDDVNVDELRAPYDEWIAEVTPDLPEGLQLLGLEVVRERDFTWSQSQSLEIVNKMELSGAEE
jgi:hypothetical protein